EPVSPPADQSLTTGEVRCFAGSIRGRGNRAWFSPYRGDIAFAAGGRQVLLGRAGLHDEGPTGKVECKVQVWDAEDGQLRRQFEVPHESACMAFTPDGKHAIYPGMDGVVCIWDVASGMEV